MINPKEHRWSGWPGAYCLDCGEEDQMEICIATHDEEYCTEHVNRFCKAKPADEDA